MSKPLLILFLRELVLGKVKTRLAASLGDVGALRIYERLLTHTLREASQVEARRQAWYSQALNGGDLAAPYGFEARAQCSGDLGARMRHAFAQGFAEGHAPIIIIGSDLPGISAQLLRDAFAAMSTHDAVLGPSADGGYYLLGLNAPLDALFAEKQWSGPTVFAHTASDLVLHGRSYHLLPVLRDVDTADDLGQVRLP
jgi:hypothetical protein